MINSRRILVAAFAASPLLAAGSSLAAEAVRVTNNVPVTVTNPASQPVPVAGAVTINGTPGVNVTNTVPVTVTNTVPVTVTNPAPLTVAAIPANPFFGRLDGNNSAKAMGAAAATIGVTSIIFNNETNQTQLVNFFNAVATDPTLCAAGSGVAIGGAFPYLYFTLEPSKSTQFTFPTPLVFSSVNAGGITCIGSNLPAGVQLFVSGVTE